MKIFILILFCCLSANAQNSLNPSHYHYSYKPVPFELNCAENAKNTALPTMTWFACYHFKLINADVSSAEVSVSMPFSIEKNDKNIFKIRFLMPSDSALREYLNDTVAIIYVKTGGKTIEFKTKMQPVPYFRALLVRANFSPNIIDTVHTFWLQGVWERPPCAVFATSRFAGHFSTYLFDTFGNKLQQNDGWYDTNGDMTREYDLTAKRFGLNKGDIVELRIGTEISSLFYYFPSWARQIMLKKLKISPTQQFVQRFRLQ